MEQKAEDRIKMAELARAAGVSRRTIRYYISRGLMSGPLKAGRNAVYGPEHLERLAEIKRLQEQGLTLAEIGRVLGEGDQERIPPEPTSWWQYEVAEDVTVWVRADAAPWRTRLIKAAIARMKNHLTEQEREAEDENGE